MFGLGILPPQVNAQVSGQMAQAQQTNNQQLKPSASQATAVSQMNQQQQQFGWFLNSLRNIILQPSAAQGGQPAGVSQQNFSQFVPPVPGSPVDNFMQSVNQRAQAQHDQAPAGTPVPFGPAGGGGGGGGKSGGGSSMEGIMKAFMSIFGGGGG